MDRRRPRTSPARPLVLVVDAHEDTRALYALALAAMGFDVVAAKDDELASGLRRVLDAHNHQHAGH